MQEKLTGAAHGKEIAIHCAADRGSLAVELQVVNMGMAGQPDADFSLHCGMRPTRICASPCFGPLAKTST